MNNKEVIISIQGKQSFDDAGEETVELVTSGTYSGTENGYTLSYLESELTGLEGTTTTFQIERGRVTLLRMGPVSSQMIFEEGKKHFSLYETVYGAMTIGVSASRVKTELSDLGGDIEIDYAIEIDHAVAGENIFKINVREVGANGKNRILS
ncbi:DUF1934 domain-containing protein [Papillibacter cinnamivorans]|uniref:Uncharacterized beta-barrel protein YwiB, DUF1934 family n=1 Tax=Papillibacter cinnamivorans DSM 12816 TaxID=1122930 RepID=A0A1W1ZZW1_9FIRM|nr:DUF1934 domain-containing protein [Papillibacter cinnamivorans]SMC53924.1 Uncharacterized beta-barrel protein YwiB, DUF1934 family [Papillibacter cinnamivorans DSM 12816]